MVDPTLPTGQTLPSQVTPNQVAEWVSIDEHRSVMEKMVSTLKLPAGNLPREQSLYLEQQITDLLGFEVTSELDGHQLPSTFGMMSALPHLKRHPQDQLEEHEQFQEAGLEERRSSLGWFTEMGQLTDTAVNREKYFVSLQIDLSPEWQLQSKQLKEWYKYRKVVVINPMVQKAAVACVGDFGPGNWIQHQFGGSPEIIRQLSVWDLASQGKVFIFLVNDVDNTLPLGVMDMSMKL